MTARSVPSRLASLLELLELEQPQVVTSGQMDTLSREAGIDWPTDLVIRRLRERGWLLPLITKGVWEFAPAARAGAFGSGDPLIELRAVLARDPDAPYLVAAESAGYTLGLSSRRPNVECVSAPPANRLPKSLKTLRVVRWEPKTLPLIREGLPTWPHAVLIAFMASRPSGYHDWPNVGEWLSQAASTLALEDLRRELEGRSSGAWARAAYLLDRGGAPDAAAALLEAAPEGRGPYYLGNRSLPGRHCSTYDVIDSVGLEVRGK